ASELYYETPMIAPFRSSVNFQIATHHEFLISLDAHLEFDLSWGRFWLTPKAQFPLTLPRDRVFKRGGMYEAGHAAAICQAHHSRAGGDPCIPIAARLRPAARNYDAGLEPFRAGVGH